MFDKKTYIKAYYQLHKEQYRERSKARTEYRKAYYQSHREQIKETMKEWRQAHMEQVRGYWRKHYLSHTKLVKERALIWRSTHRERARELHKRHSQTPKGKITRRKRNCNRRQLGFIPLNSYFEGSEGHHIDRERVIYIPKALHQNIPHSVLHNTNMETINTAAMVFLQEA